MQNKKMVFKSCISLLKAYVSILLILLSNQIRDTGHNIMGSF